MIPGRSGLSPACFCSISPGTVCLARSRIAQLEPGRSNKGPFHMGRPGAAIAQVHVVPSTEQRSCRRFELVSPVLFRWHNASEHYEIGYCTNLGLGGVFIRAT